MRLIGAHIRFAQVSTTCGERPLPVFSPHLACKPSQITMIHPCGGGQGSALLSLPELCLENVLRQLDGRSLAAMEAVHSSFSQPLLERTARDAYAHRCPSARSDSSRFR